MVKFVILFQLLLLAGCGICANRIGAKEYYEIIKIPRERETERIEKFSSYSIEKQIDIYLFARNCPDDPNIGLLLYKNGAEKIPYVVERVQNTEAIWDKGYLVQVLYNINRDCRCVSKNSNMITVLEQVEKELDANKDIPKDYVYKKIYSDNLKFLKEQIEEQNQ